MSKATCDGCGKERRDVQTVGRDSNGDPDGPDLCFLCRRANWRRPTKTAANRHALLRAIHYAAVEHGVPNGFHLEELRVHYGAPHPSVSGRLMRAGVRARTLPRGVKYVANVIVLSSDYPSTPPR